MRIKVSLVHKRKTEVSKDFIKLESYSAVEVGLSYSAVEVGLMLLEIADSIPTKYGKKRGFKKIETLQKLVFISHGYYMALRDKKLIDEDVFIETNGPYYEGFLKAFVIRSDGYVSYKDQNNVLDEIHKNSNQYQFVKYIFKTFVLKYEVPCQNLDYLTMGSIADWFYICLVSRDNNQPILPNLIIKKRFLDDMSMSIITSYDLDAYKKYKA